MVKYCHVRVREIAKEMAGVAYETLARDDVFYKSHPNQNVFVANYWKLFVESARQSLLKILGGDYPEAMKEEVMEIYTQDYALRPDKKPPIHTTVGNA